MKGKLKNQTALVKSCRMPRSRACQMAGAPGAVRLEIA